MINSKNKKIKDLFSSKIKSFNENMKSKNFWKKTSVSTFKKLTKNKVIIAVIIFLIFANTINNSILTWGNIKGVFQNYSQYGIMAIGMTFVIITAGIDLSVGSILGVSAMNTAIMINSGTNANVAVFVSLLLGLAIGIGHGLLIGYAKMAPFIVSLAGMLIYRGIAITKLNPPVQASANGIGTNSVLDWWRDTSFLNLSVQIWALIVIALIAIFVLRFTIFGRRIYAIGGNKNAAKLSGINVRLVETSVYGITGFLSSFASLIILSNIPTASSDMGQGNELDVIAMVVVGGTSLSGGRGKILGTLIGWITLSILLNALLLMGYPASYQKILSGLIILFAVLLDGSGAKIAKKTKVFLKKSILVFQGKEKYDFSRLKVFQVNKKTFKNNKFKNKGEKNEKNKNNK